MFLLIEVDNQNDVGNNELNRYLVSGKPIIDKFIGDKDWRIQCRGSNVHPATKK